jgi:hypothetical protein
MKRSHPISLCLSSNIHSIQNFGASSHGVILCCWQPVMVDPDCWDPILALKRRALLRGGDLRGEGGCLRRLCRSQHEGRICRTG